MCWFEEFDVNVLVSHLLRLYMRKTSHIMYLKSNVLTVYRHVTNVKLKFGVTIHPKHGNKYIRL